MRSRSAAPLLIRLSYYPVESKLAFRRFLAPALRLSYHLANIAHPIPCPLSRLQTVQYRRSGPGPCLSPSPTRIGSLAQVPSQSPRHGACSVCLPASHVCCFGLPGARHVDNVCCFAAFVLDMNAVYNPSPLVLSLSFFLSLFTFFFVAFRGVFSGRLPQYHWRGSIYLGWAS